MGAATLRDLVFVVRENQVAAAAVDIDSVTQVRANHGRALQVPARAAATPGTVPARVILCGGFPQHEIAGVALVVGHLYPGARQHVIQ